MVNHNETMMTSAPMVLASVLARAACFAIRLAVIAASCAVTVVPILAPMIITSAVWISIRLAVPSATSTPVQAELLCMAMVANAPIASAPSIGISGMTPLTGWQLTDCNALTNGS